MPYYEERFAALSSDQRDTILEFLDCLTEGDVIPIARELSMFPSDIRKLTKALEAYKGE